MASPTQRTMAKLRADGYRPIVVEQRGRYGRTHDLLGFVDVLAFGDGVTLAVQATSVSNVAHRVIKTLDSPWLGPAKRAGWRVVVHGWRDEAYAGRLPELREVEV